MAHHIRCVWHSEEPPVEGPCVSGFAARDLSLSLTADDAAGRNLDSICFTLSVLQGRCVHCVSVYGHLCSYEVSSDLNSKNRKVRRWRAFTKAIIFLRQNLVFVEPECFKATCGLAQYSFRHCITNIIFQYNGLSKKLREPCRSLEMHRLTLHVSRFHVCRCGNSEPAEDIICVLMQGAKTDSRALTIKRRSSVELLVSFKRLITLTRQISWTASALSKR